MCTMARMHTRLHTHTNSPPAAAAAVADKAQGRVATAAWLYLLAWHPSWQWGVGQASTVWKRQAWVVGKYTRAQASSQHSA